MLETCGTPPVRPGDAAFEAVLDLLGIPWALKDGQGTYRRVNGAWERSTGLGRAATVGRTDSDLFPEEIARALRAHDLAATAAGVVTESEETLPASTGPRTYSVRRFPGGDEGALSLVLTEVTGLKQLERALAQSVAQERAIQASLGDMVLIADREGRVRYVSPNSERLFGHRPEALLGDLFVHVHPEDRPGLREKLQSLGGAGSRGVLELRYQRADGDYRWVEFSAHDLLDDPQVKGVVGSVRDIGERKQVEQNLRESEARFKALHNASFGGIVIHDKGVILDCNQGLSEMTGYSLQELIGMDGLLLIAEQSRAMVREKIRSGYERAYEGMGLRKNGEEFPMRLEARNIPYQGKMMRSVEFRDITETRRAEEERARLQEQLTQSQKLESVGRLAGGVAHDYNNMLSVILGYSELALTKLAPTDPLAEDLQQILGAAQRSAEITRQLLAFARKQPIAPKVVDINAAVDGMLNMLRRLIGEEIEIAWHPGQDGVRVRVDPSQVEQVLLNLCANARDAIAGQGRIVIRTEVVSRPEGDGAQPGEYVLLSVQDSGCGMNAETLKHIFEPFFTTKEVSKGTGLGLATVYGIVQQNGGSVGVESEVGRGSTFRVLLPRYRGEVMQAVPEPAGGKALAGGETVLLVEDEPAIRKMCARVLERLGYRVAVAAGPEEALALVEAREAPVDLLLSDVIMPGLNGRELAERLRARCPGLRVLFMSGYDADAVATRGVLESGVHFIQKPFAMRALGPKLREVLQQPPFPAPGGS